MRDANGAIIARRKAFDPAQPYESPQLGGANVSGKYGSVGNVGTMNDYTNANQIVNLNPSNSAGELGDIKQRQMKENQAELLKQIEERRRKVEADKNRAKQEDVRLDQQVRDDLKKLNTKHEAEIRKEREKKGVVQAS